MPQRPEFVFGVWVDEAGGFDLRKEECLELQEPLEVVSRDTVEVLGV